MRSNILLLIDLHSHSYSYKSKLFIGTSVFKNMCHLKLHLSSTKSLFRQMSRRDADDEFIWETILFLLLTLFRAHNTTGIKEHLGLGWQLQNSDTSPDYLFKFRVTPGHYILVLKNALAPLFDLQSSFKKYQLKFQMWFMFIFSNNTVKPHSCGDKDLRNKFPVVVSRWDNIKTKGSSQTFISEDLS